MSLPVAAPDPRLQTLRRGGRVRSSVLLLGPAFVAATAYVDPGNFATNSSAGAEFGYLLVWVIVLANGMAMLIQMLSGNRAGDRAQRGRAVPRALPAARHGRAVGTGRAGRPRRPTSPR